MAAKGYFRRCVFALLIIAATDPAAAQTASQEATSKIGPLAARQLTKITGTSRVIVRLADGVAPNALAPAIEATGGSARRYLSLINSQVVEMPNAAIALLAAHPAVSRVSFDRPVFGAMERTSATIGATGVREALGYDGAGIGVAIIDSGVSAWHDDLTAPGGALRVRRFVDFVNGRAVPYDDYGHGSHVTGIVAGNGYDSNGARSGVAPGAHVIALKVLDASGRGYISSAIAALDYVVAHKDELNVRVVNLSVAAGVFESYETDPLTLAAKRAVEAGLTVVAAAGNRGRTPAGRDAYAGITAPANAPWVLSVGASSHKGTSDRRDDVMAPFSSRGPTPIDYAAKPDIVAPGMGIESLSAPFSTLSALRSQYLLSGTVPTPYPPYLSLSGTSMAAPVATGTVALMLQANPSLTPNQIKAILQYTAEIYPNYDPLTEGAGFLNAEGAVKLAASFAGTASMTTLPADWSKRLLWGNRVVSGGRLTPNANAWLSGLTWGSQTAPDGQIVEWGVMCSAEGCDASSETSKPWRDDNVSPNVVWGSVCGGANCAGPWTIQALNDDDSVVWGTMDDDSVVWGTTDDDSVVWGTNDDDSVVWGTSCGDIACEPMIWPSQ